MSKNKTSALSIETIRKLALYLRKKLDLSNYESVDVVKLYDKLSLIKVKGKNFCYIIVPDEDKELSKKEEAKTDVINRVIYIKEWVWNSACSNKHSRAQYTLSHELGHFFLECLFNLSLYRVSDDTKVLSFEDPEWQANTFAAEFLMPYDACKDMDANEIYERFNVSKKCAEVRYKKINKKK